MQAEPSLPADTGVVNTSTTGSVRNAVIATLQHIVFEHHKLSVVFTEETPLIGSGLDSLSLAVAAVRLEELLEVDPFATDIEGRFPLTIGDMIKLYQNAVV